MTKKKYHKSLQYTITPIINCAAPIIDCDSVKDAERKLKQGLPTLVKAKDFVNLHSEMLQYYKTIDLVVDYCVPHMYEPPCYFAIYNTDKERRFIDENYYEQFEN